MTPPIKSQGYVQVGAWATKRADNTAFANAGVTAGGTLKTNNGFYLNGELGIGSALRGEVKLGKDTHLGNGFGIDVSARAEYNHQFRTTNVNIPIPSHEHRYEVNVPAGEEANITDAYGDKYNIKGPGTAEYKYQFDGDPIDIAYNSQEVKFAGRVEGVMKKFSVGQIRAGVEAGYQIEVNNKPVTVDRTLITNINVDGNDYQMSSTTTTKYTPKNEGFYVTPTLSGELNLNKNGNLKLVADLSLTEARAGINWVF